MSEEMGFVVELPERMYNCALCDEDAVEWQQNGSGKWEAVCAVHHGIPIPTNGDE
jgi:hypothetical protein